jgi:signal transduction histidine kinase
MRERAAMLGGVVEVKGTPGEGTAVTVRVPLQGSPRDKR